MFDEKYFFTESYNLGAYLKAHDFKVVDRYEINNKSILYFDRNDDLQKCIDKFNNDPFIKKFIRSFNEVKYWKKDE